MRIAAAACVLALPASCDKLADPGLARPDVAVAADLDLDLDDARDGQTAPTVVRWQRPAPGESPTFGLLPFPDDLYLSDADGTVSDALPGLRTVATSNTSLLRDQLGHLTGFGRTTAVHFFLDGPLDPDTAVPGASALLFDLDALEAGQPGAIAVDTRYLPELDCLSLVPELGLVLPPGHRFAAVLTTALAAPDGRPVVADAELVSALDAAADDAEPHAAAARLLAGHGVLDPSRLAGLAVYTTQRSTDALVALAERVRTELPAPTLDLTTPPAPLTAALFGRATSPSLDDWLGAPERDAHGEPWPGFDNPGGIAHDHIAAVLTGSFLAPSFVDPASGRFESAQGDDHRLAEEPVRLPVTFVIPTAPPPSAAGYPVVVIGHGLRADRSSQFARADAWAEAGFVLVEIDDVYHGARDGKTDTRNNFAGSWDGPDGLPDEPSSGITFFASFKDMRQLRDHFRQTVLDQVSLVRLVRDPSLDLSVVAAAGGIAVPHLDPDHVYWEGGSLGGMMGTMVMAVEPAIQAATLHVTGGSFIGLMATGSAQMNGVVSVALDLILGVRGGRVDRFHPVSTLLATVAEPGDPLVYAPLLDPSGSSTEPGFRARSLLLTYALDDEVMPNLASRALMRSAGLPLVDPLVSVPGLAEAHGPLYDNQGGATRGAVQYAPASHGLGWVRFDYREYVPGHPHDTETELFPRLAERVVVETPVREHLAQSVTFISTHLHSGSARLEVTAPAVADFDGDGVLDDSERASGTDPWDPTSH